MKTAYVDLKSGNAQVRCPECNSWDKAWSGLSGQRTCESCDLMCEVPVDQTVDTVPARVRSEMEAVEEHNRELFKTYLGDR